MEQMNVRFVDLITPHLEMEEQLVALFRDALRSAGFVGGKPVQQFEAAFASFCETEHCVGVGSGTDAVRFALLAAGVSAGDSVITAPNSFIATTEAITQAGAFPEFVDIDERTYNIDANKIRDYVELRCDRDPATGRPVSHRTGRTITAIVPIHLYGQVADMDAILEIADIYNLLVIEDACQAHGSEYFSRDQQRWRKAGSIGEAAAFSFYPGKNLGACGEAGAVMTNNPKIADTVRKLRDHGQATKYYHDLEGYNGRLDTIQAGILDAKLVHLPAWNRQRRQMAESYAEQLADLDAITLPFEPSWSRSIYHLYVVKIPHRDEMQKDLCTAGIGTGIHYPIPLHLQRAYRHLGYHTGDFPIAEKVAGEILSLPMHPYLTHQQSLAVCDAIRECLAKKPELAMNARP